MRSPRPRGSRSRTSGSRPRCARGSRSCARRAPGSSTPATPSGSGSSATSTTARSSGSSGSSLSLRLLRGRRRRRGRGGSSEAEAELRHAARRAARARARHLPGRPRRRGPRRRVEALAEEPACPIRIDGLPEAATTPRSRPPPTRSSPRRPDARRQPLAVGASASTACSSSRSRRRRRRARPRRARGPGRRARRPARRRPRDGRRGHDPRGAPVRVVIADDEMLLREGLARLLVDAGFEVVGKAGTADELLRRVELTRPDVAIVDIRMPPTHTDEGLVAAQEIRSHAPGRRRARPLPLRRVALRDAPARGPPGALRLPAQGARLRPGRARRRARSASPTASASSIRRSSRGSSRRPRDESPLDELTPRELEVLALMAEGRSNDGICKQLFLSPKTVETHVRHILAQARHRRDRPSTTAACSRCSPTCAADPQDSARSRRRRRACRRARCVSCGWR